MIEAAGPAVQPIVPSGRAAKLAALTLKALQLKQVLLERSMYCAHPCLAQDPSAVAAALVELDMRSIMKPGEQDDAHVRTVLEAEGVELPK